uniref:Plexin-D1 n=1 Tax=Sphaerodactylus townsendi TaxID=933632 RepID=A0ACB8EHI0_9SAUR
MTNFHPSKTTSRSSFGILAQEPSFSVDYVLWRQSKLVVNEYYSATVLQHPVLYEFSSVIMQDPVYEINLNSSMKVISRESITVAYGEPVHPLMQFDPSDSSYLYLMTSHQVARVKVSVCDQYATCNECLAAADAYCGWCTLETRCSVQHECANFVEPNFWISASEGVRQCPSMTIIPSEINIDEENQAMIIQIHGNIPNLNGMKMSCDYGNDVTTVATAAKVPADSLNQFVYCNFLPREKYPAFPSNQDHVIVQTAVRVNGKSIVWANFTIYDCKRTGNVYPKTA